MCQDRECKSQESAQQLQGSLYKSCYRSMQLRAMALGGAAAATCSHPLGTMARGVQGDGFPDVELCFHHAVPCTGRAEIMCHC